MLFLPLGVYAEPASRSALQTDKPSPTMLRSCHLRCRPSSDSHSLYRKAILSSYCRSLLRELYLFMLPNSAPKQKYSRISFDLNVPPHISSLYGASLDFPCSHAFPLIFFNCTTPGLANVFAEKSHIAEKKVGAEAPTTRTQTAYLFAFLARVSIILISHRLVEISLAESRIVVVFCLSWFELQISLVVLERL